MSRRRPGLPVGVRLAAVTALLVLGVGSTLLVASYWLLAHRLPDSVVYEGISGPTTVQLVKPVEPVEPVQAPAAVARDKVKPAIPDGPPLTIIVPEQVKPIPATTPVPSPLLSGTPGSPPSKAIDVPPSAGGDIRVTEAVLSATSNYGDTLMRSFAAQSAMLLGVLTVAAVAVGGFAARRALRPVHAMTEAARLLGAESLDERIPLAGPRDELYNLAETFNAMLDRVEAAFGRERRLMANISHELRTPLANQRAALEIALEDPEASARELRHLAETVLTQNQRVHRLIEELLVLTSAEQDANDDDGVADLADLAREAAKSAQALPGAVPGLDIRLDLAPAPVSGQPVLLERLVGNLVENAVRHNFEGGFVRVSTSGGNGVGRVEVENSGPVIPAHEIGSLFEPFRRGAAGKGDRIRADHGVGLGLSIVAAVARRYGSRVDATARVEGGLRACLTLAAPRD